jgi:subtilisin family serine protease
MSTLRAVGQADSGCCAMPMRTGGAVQPQLANAKSSLQSGASRPTNPFDLIKIASLMDRTSGRSEVKIGLIDGPVLLQHPDLAREHVREVPGSEGACKSASSDACRHGTFVAGILSATRGSSAPAICPGCTLLIRRIFPEAMSNGDRMPSATPRALAAAIIECIEAGARVINLSLGLAQPLGKEEAPLEQALDHAVRRGAIVVAAAGNQGALGSSALTRHPWVIPVVAYDLAGRPTNESNLGGSIGRRGLGAPGDGVTSLGTDGGSVTLGGTSVATPFVAGAIALLWSEFPLASATQIKLAVAGGSGSRRATVIPPLLDAAAAHQLLSTTSRVG